MSSLHGIVLAAGASRRMGSPKPLLRTRGGTFIEHAVRVLLEGGCGGVTAVCRARDDVTAALARAAGAIVLDNPDPGSEQAASLRIGLGAVPADAGAVLVLPVDHPRVGPRAVRAVADAWRTRGASIVRPVYDGTPGHPTLFSRRLFEELAADDLPEGARTVIERHREAVDDVEVDEPGIVQDVNTPAEYQDLAVS